MEEVLPPEVGAKIADAVRQASRTDKTIAVEYELTVNSVAKTFEARLLRMNDDEVVAIVRDITTMRKAQKSQESAEANFRAFMENSPAIAFVKDLEGRYLFANRQWETQFSPPRTDWAGKTDFDFWPAKTAEQIRAGDRLVSASRHSAQQDESITTANGEVRQFVAYKFLMPGLAGAPTIGACVVDVTTTRRVEEQLRQAQKMEAVGQLASGVAHDFNNLLTVIFGYCSMMLEGRSADDRWHGPLTEAIRATQKAAELTRQLLAFGRKQILQPKVVDLNQVLRQSALMLRRLIGPDIELETHWNSEAPLVLADPGQLEQVVVNLVVNARDAMSDGGKITLAVERREIKDGESRTSPELKPGVYAVLSVRDTGHGIDEASRPRIFEPFFTTKEVGKGTGLGLSTVYGIVKQSGGHIEVASEVGKGATFTIHLPGEPADAANVPIGPAANRWPVGTETILLVEDEDVVRELCRVVLTDCGYKVIDSNGGEDAQRKATDRKEKIDLLLTDFVMPKMNGRKLARMLRLERPDLKVLYMSGLAEGELSPEGTEQPIDFLEKPFTASTLAVRVRRILDGSP